MACCDDQATYLKTRITRTEDLIAKYEDAIGALASGAQSYQLDTGQTRQLVTKANLAQMRNMLEHLENRRETLRARLCGGGVIARPGF